MPERHKSTFTLIGVAILTQKVRIVYKALAQAKTTSSGDIADIWSGSALGSQGSLLNDQCQPVLRVNLENWLKHFSKERVDQFFKTQMQKVIDVRPVLCLQLAKLVNIRYFVCFSADQCEKCSTDPLIVHDWNFFLHSQKQTSVSFEHFFQIDCNTRIEGPHGDELKSYLNYQYKISQVEP